MYLSRKHLGNSVLAFALFSWACGSDTTGPNAENFDAETTSAGLEVVEGAFDTDAFASLEVLGDEFGIPGAAAPAATELLRVAAAPDSPDFSERISAAAADLMATSAAPAVVLIPEDYRGLTLTYDLEEGYIVDETRTDGPANGIRFILYAVNPITEEIAEPLTEIGYADVTDESTETVAAIGLEVVSGEVTYLDYTVTLSGTIVAPTFTLAGFLTDGTDRVDFDLVHSYAVNIAGVTIGIDYDIEVGDFTMDVILEIVQSDDTESVTVDVSFSDGTDTVTIEGSTTNGLGTLEVFGNDILFATVTVSETGITVVDAAGEPLSQQEIESLQDITEIIEEAGDIFEDLMCPVEFLFDD